MTRRFQFSLRWLLIGAILVCLLLGTWRLVSECKGYVEVRSAKFREPLKIKGRIVRFFGPEQLQYSFSWNKAGEPLTDGTLGRWFMSRGTVDRRWLCVYEIDELLTIPPTPPGEYEFNIVAGSRQVVDENAIKGHMTITRR